MRRWLYVGLSLLLLISFIQVNQAALAQGEETSEQAVITSPLPVSELFGATVVRGTANVPEMAYYYLELLPLNPDFTMPQDTPWIPVTTAVKNAVENGTLTTIDTTTVEDGLYALRLTVTTGTGRYFYNVVAPLRVNNARYSELVDQIKSQLQGDGLATATALPTLTITPVPPTSQPSTTPDSTPRVTVIDTISAANVRQCDIADNSQCPVVGYLRRGQTAQVLAVSNNTSGWFQIVLPTGLVGWIAPSIVIASGDINAVPRIAPPAPIIPQPTATPIAFPRVIPNGMAIEGGSAVCGTPFNVLINIANLGTIVSAPGTLSLQDVYPVSGDVNASASVNYPSLNPGQNYVVRVQFTVTAYYNVEHELRARTNNQQFTIRYTLAQGNCNR
ncbi:MAG: SH3 domain-containing protein [Anaerolineae bacterium]|nr:SH3 domain-containing protein [Anaerolineae bacterium]